MGLSGNKVVFLPLRISLKLSYSDSLVSVDRQWFFPLNISSCDMSAHVGMEIITADDG